MMELVQIEGIVAPQWVFCPLLRSTLERVCAQMGLTQGPGRKGARMVFLGRDTVGGACRGAWAALGTPHGPTLHERWVD